jgi:hypothetical protein
MKQITKCPFRKEAGQEAQSDTVSIEPVSVEPVNVEHNFDSHASGAVVGLDKRLEQVPLCVRRNPHTSVANTEFVPHGVGTSFC